MRPRLTSAIQGPARTTGGVGAERAVIPASAWRTSQVSLKEINKEEGIE